MAPKYRLTYFNARARAEPIRYLFAYGGADFEDVRVEQEEWSNLKPTTPYGKLPVLEVDGKTVTQSAAICRYLAKKFNLFGVDDWQNLKIDATVDTIVDLRTAIGMAYRAPESEKAAKVEVLEKETLPFYLGRLDAQVKENGGFLVDKKLSWADLFFAAAVDGANRGLARDAVADYPNLKTLVDKVWALPKIKAYRDKQPETPF